MEESEWQRLQELVDAIHHTAAALVRVEWGAQLASHPPYAGGPLPAMAWRPMPGPRGWPLNPLGSESKSMVPYLNPFIPSMIPLYPGLTQSPGLLHAGMGPMGGGIPVGASIGMGVPYAPYGTYGYRHPGMLPYGYGYGLMHAGWEGPGIGGGSPLIGGGIGYGYGPSQGYGSIGYGPIGYGSVGYGPIPYGLIQGNPLQPSWSGPVSGPNGGVGGPHI